MNGMVTGVRLDGVRSSDGAGDGFFFEQPVVHAFLTVELAVSRL